MFSFQQMRLELCFLQTNDVGLQDPKHVFERSLLIPGMVAQHVVDSADVERDEPHVATGRACQVCNDDRWITEVRNIEFGNLGLSIVIVITRNVFPNMAVTSMM